MRDERDYAAHVDYIHINPVKHGYVKRVSDWPYSTFHRFVARGIYPLNWAGEGCADLCAGGEDRRPECALRFLDSVLRRLLQILHRPPNISAILGRRGIEK